MKNIVYQTTFGTQYYSDSFKLIQDKEFRIKYKGKINLIFTSPPFDLNNPKEYGNYNDTQYEEWLSNYALPLKELLTEDGSIVIELGNSWNKNSPTFDLTPIKTLIKFKEKSGLHLCQEIICQNPSRLPSPATYVNKERIRLKDSYTRLWWFSKSQYPKADNYNILIPYSNAMNKLLKTQKFNSGNRPSGHNISEKGFLKDNGGAILSTFFKKGVEINNTFEFSNTMSDSLYYQFCNKNRLRRHPARMQKEIVEIFLRFLTDKNDIVLDIFSGSNTTGYVAENLQRNWVSIDLDLDYCLGSSIRFKTENEAMAVIKKIL